MLWVTRRLSPKPGLRREALAVLRNFDVASLAQRLPGCLAADLRPVEGSGDLLLVSCWQDAQTHDDWPTRADPHLLHVLAAVLDPLLTVPFLQSPVARAGDQPTTPV